MRADQEADFRQYVSARSDRLRRYAYLCCGDWHRAEDAVQAAFIKLYSAWSRTSPEPHDRYVRRIVTNILIDERRRSRFHQERTTDLLPDQPVPDGAQRTVETITIMSALAQLPPRQRAAVVLRYWEDLSVEHVAEILRCSPGTVKSQSSRALGTLRGLLAEPSLEPTFGASS